MPMAGGDVFRPSAVGGGAAAVGHSRQEEGSVVLLFRPGWPPATLGCSSHSHPEANLWDEVFVEIFQLKYPLGQVSGRK